MSNWSWEHCLIVAALVFILIVIGVCSWPAKPWPRAPKDIIQRKGRFFDA